MATLLMLLLPVAWSVGSAEARPEAATITQVTSVIAFVGPGGIYVMNVDGSEVHHLGGGRGADNPAWSPDGRKLAFDRHDSSYRNDNIYVMNSDGSAVRRLTHDGISSAPSWSPDGRRIVYERDTTRGYEVDLMNADGSGRQVVAHNGAGLFSQPAWSPDGRHIAYSCDCGSGDFGIAIINADGSGLRRLTLRGYGVGHLYNSAPRWSPDGRKIAYYEEFDDGGTTDVTDVWVMNADGSARRRLTRNGRSADPSWSPLSTEIVYDTGTQIHVMNANGAAKRRLTTGPGFRSAPAWSPAR